MGAAGDIALTCRCGRLRGTLRAGSGSNLLCHCADCRAAERHITGAVPQGPIPIFQTTPDRIRIDAGIEHLACIRLSGKGLVRWYAACCGTPLANTPARGGLPFVGIAVAAVAPAGRASLGPVLGEGFVPDGKGGTRHRGILRVAGGVVVRALAARIAGRERHAPFFAPDGAPIRPPHVLTAEERARAYAGV